MAKRIDPVKAKAKRDKIVAGVLAGVLLAALAVSVPMTLKMWKRVNGPGQQEAAAQTTPAPGSIPLAPPPLEGDSGIAGTVSAPVDSSRLRAFDLFESKDPFDQQIDVSAVDRPSTPAPAGAQPQPVGAGSRPVLTPGATAAPLPKTPEPPPTSAVISVNGAPAELLGLGVVFPLPPAEPIFRLHSLARGRVRVAIVGGSYADGAATILVRVGKPLTLENTADGTRYELRLLWVGAGPPPAGLVPPPPTAAAPAATPSTPAATP